MSFAERLHSDLAAAAHGVLVLLGDRLGLYRAIEASGEVDSVELARCTGTSERYVREWLAAQASAGYVEYDPERGTYRLDGERAAHLAGGGADAGELGAFEVVASLWRDEAKLTHAFRTGAGIGWDEHHPSLFRGLERMHEASWSRHLLGAWIPALPELRAALERGARIVDIGCGSGAATRLLARAFPACELFGVDSHRPSVERARALAKEAGLEARLRYEVATAKDFSGEAFDLATSFHCLLDLGDPTGAARRVRNALVPDGSFLVVEPEAEGSTAEARFFSSYATCVSVPASRSQEVGACLGARAGATALRGVLAAGGFTRIQRIAHTAGHRVYASRP